MPSHPSVRCEVPETIQDLGSGGTGGVLGSPAVPVELPVLRLPYLRAGVAVRAQVQGYHSPRYYLRGCRS